jgi:type IV secretory pathway TrbD component
MEWRTQMAKEGASARHILVQGPANISLSGTHIFSDQRSVPLRRTHLRLLHAGDMDMTCLGGLLLVLVRTSAKWWRARGQALIILVMFKHKAIIIIARELGLRSAPLLHNEYVKT